MTITAKGKFLRVVLKGGAGQDGGGSTAEDCEAVAEGALEDKVLQARLVPFEGDVISLTAVDIASMDPAVFVRFEGSRALVQARFMHCGLRNVLAGPYKHNSN